MVNGFEIVYSRPEDCRDDEPDVGGRLGEMQLTSNHHRDSLTK